MRGGRILAVRGGALGDTVLLLPALEALRAAVGPAGGVELLGTAPAIRLAASPGPATAVHSIDQAAFRALFAEGAEDAELLSFLARFDLVVAWSKLPLLSRKLRARGTPSIEVSPHPPEGVHASDHLYQSLAPLGITGATPDPNIRVTDAARHAALAFLELRGLRPGRFVAIHPSSGSPKKNWAAGSFRGFAERVRHERHGLLWVEGEADEAVVRPLEAAVPAPVARDLSLEALAALLSEAGMFVGNDSGVAHVAAAVGAPSLVLFGPTDPRNWAPRGRFVDVVDFGTSAETLWGKAREIIPVQ